MSICKVNAYSAFIFLVKEGEIWCFLPSAWIVVQFVNVFHFYFLPFLLRVQLWSSPLSLQVTNSPLWNSSFMTKRFSNTHEMLLASATTQHHIPNCSFNHTDSYFILAPSLLSTLLAVLVSCTSLRPLFLFCHFVIEDYLAMELLFNNRRNCLQKAHFRLLLHVHEASKASDWKHRYFISAWLRSAWLGEKKKGEGLVYLVIDTMAELEAWTLITGVPESKGDSDPG